MCTQALLSISTVFRNVKLCNLQKHPLFFLLYKSLKGNRRFSSLVCLLEWHQCTLLEQEGHCLVLGTPKALQSPLTVFLCWQSGSEIFYISFFNVQLGPLEMSDVFMLYFCCLSSS